MLLWVSSCCSSYECCEWYRSSKAKFSEASVIARAAEYVDTGCVQHGSVKYIQHSKLPCYSFQSFKGTTVVALPSRNAPCLYVLLCTLCRAIICGVFEWGIFSINKPRSEQLGLILHSSVTFKICVFETPKDFSSTIDYIEPSVSNTIYLDRRKGDLSPSHNVGRLLS